MLENREIRQTCYILVSSDRGLAGPYNASVFRAFHAYVEEHHPDGNFVVAAIGHKAFSYCKRNKYKMLNDEAINVRDDIQFIDFKSVSEMFIGDYLKDRLDKIVVFYNHFINTITQEVEYFQLLPIEEAKENEEINDTSNDVKLIYSYEPNPQAIIDHLLPMYVENTLYGIILDAKASEHASRMTAMKSATDNAEDLINSLQLHYNRARQAAITVELTDIIGGANAVN
jgi:F-type H+-transporting ATPase subunit gamma